MTVAYTNFIQTSVANIIVEDKLGSLGNSNTITYFNDNAVTLNLGNSILIAEFPQILGNLIYFDSYSDNVAPVNITGNFNVPVYIDGTTVDPNYFYPFYQNTSTTANGYLANSTSSFQPPGAAILAITNGTDNWYKFADSNVTVTPSLSNIAMIIEAGTQLVANANTTVQILPFIRDTVTPNTLIGLTTLMTTVELVANRPVSVYTGVTYSPVQSNIAAGSGLLIRNCTANTRVNIPHTTMESTYSPALNI